MGFIQKCMDIWADPFREVARWKNDHGYKVIGWGTMYAPEELIAAAGCLPVYLHGEHTAVTDGNRLLQSYFCPPLRLMSDSAMKVGFDIVDSMLLVSNCDELEHITHLLDVVAGKRVHSMHVPFALYQPVCQDKLRTEISKVRRELEQLTGKRITEEALRTSIATYNHTRRLLRKLYALRVKSPGILSGVEMRAIVGASMFMPKEIYNAELEAFLSELEADSQAAVNWRAKVVIVGSICDDPGDEVLEAIEESGIAVVNDDMFIGGHYIRYDVDEDCDPYEAITKIYWEGVPTPCKLQRPQRCYAEGLVEMVEESGAQGIIDLEWKFCEFQSYARPYLREVFDNAGVPFIRIDLVEESMAKEAIKTRCETFAEVLERKNNGRRE